MQSLCQLLYVLTSAEDVDAALVSVVIVFVEGTDVFIGAECVGAGIELSLTFPLAPA